MNQKYSFPKIILITLGLLLTAYGLLNPSLTLAESQPLEISGYYKALFNKTKSSFTKEDIYALNQRLRIELRKQIDPWQFYIALDNEALLNDFANTPDFDVIRSRTQEKTASIDLDKVSVDNDPLYLKHSVYRAYIKYYSSKYQVVIGKQAIDWGKMRFYSPLDLFNRLGSTDIERNEKIGVDALNLNISPSAFSGLNIIVAPGSEEKTKLGLKLYTKIKTYDLSLIGALINKDAVAGFAFDGYLLDAGLRGEFTYTWDDNGRTYPRLSIGADYNPTEKLSVLFEQFYNGGADDNNPTALFSYAAAQKIMSLKKHISSLNINYQITPLWTFDYYLIYDWEGKSVVMDHELKYNITQNMDLSAGIQNYWGDNDSEFGGYAHLYFAEVKLFF